MFVSPAEFHETILAVQHHPFHRMERAAALDALDEALQRDGGAGIAHASAAAAAVAAGAAPPSPGVLRRPGPASRMAERFPLGHKIFYVKQNLIGDLELRSTDWIFSFDI